MFSAFPKLLFPPFIGRGLAFHIYLRLLIFCRTKTEQWDHLCNLNVNIFVWTWNKWTDQPSVTNKHVRLTTSEGSFCQWNTFILKVGVFLGRGCPPYPQIRWLHLGLLPGWGGGSDGVFMPGMGRGGGGILHPGGRGGGAGISGSRAGIADCPWEDEETPCWEGDVFPGGCCGFLERPVVGERLRSALGFSSSKSISTWMHLFTFWTDLLDTALWRFGHCMLDSRFSVACPTPIFLFYKTTRRCMD